MQTQTVKAVAQADTNDGFNQSKLPIDRESIRSRRLLRLIELVEVLRVPDNDRTIWQMLLDAGANPDFILLRDCDDDSRLARRPALQVNVNTSKLHGFLVITHNSDDTGFKILLQDKGHSVAVKTVNDIVVRKLAATLADLIDDGTRRVEIPSQGLSTNAVIAGDYLLSS
ncbi:MULTISPECIES: hypothetical protein [Pseudomonas]|uniref:Uncharacterized protein n=1 Tax=Pseudomonas monteilii TaxID=76759 RepID=A0AAP7FJX9_9PSED|nr:MULTISPECIES: hypothetical protein [Pseudomonas]OAH46264.1 hypothetical protein AYJ70_19300 [Pseudomonas monteilii]